MEKPPLYRRILGNAYETLPPQWQAMHNLDRHRVAEGTAKIDRGSGLLANLIAALFRFPAAGNDIPVRVDFYDEKGGELWKRTFGQNSFSSFQYEGSGSCKGLLCERFGPFTFGLALVIDGDKMRLVLRNWLFLGVPMPLFLGPTNNSYEFISDGMFNFFVELGHPFAGLIVRYRGQLKVIDL